VRLRSSLFHRRGGREGTGRSVARSLSVHAGLATASCEATETMEPGVSCHVDVVRPIHLCKCQDGGGPRLDGTVKVSEPLVNIVKTNRPKTLPGLTQNGNVAGLPSSHWGSTDIRATGE
jgi:transposase